MNKQRRHWRANRQHRRGSSQSGQTKVDRLLHTLSDGKWHSTRELVRRVGHSFAVAKFKLVAAGYAVERQHHAHSRWQWQYRLPQQGPDSGC